MVCLTISLYQKDMFAESKFFLLQNYHIIK